MSNSVTQSVAESLCRFIKNQLCVESPVLAAMLIYVQRLSGGEMARYVALNRARVCDSLRDMFERPLGGGGGGGDQYAQWNSALQLSRTAFNRAEIEDSLLECIPRTMSKDLQALFVEELRHLPHAALGADDIVFAYEYFSDSEQRQREGSFFTDKESTKRLLGPLCLDNVRAQLAHVLSPADRRSPHEVRQQRLLLAKKVAAWHFLDPACGAGSILVETKRLVAALISDLCKVDAGDDDDDDDNKEEIKTVQLKSENFTGIELELEAAVCADLALRMVDLELGVASRQKRILVANAVTAQWAHIEPSIDYDFIVGNPPFLGGSNVGRRQRDDMRQCWGHLLKPEMDYVTCWFKKAADYIGDENRNARAAFISTDSVTQGAQLSAIWPHLLRSVCIAFAYESVRWHPRLLVNVVVIGLKHASKVADGELALFYRAVRDEAGVPTQQFERTVVHCPLAPHLQPNVPFVDIGTRTTNISADAPPIHTGCMLQDSSDFDGFVMTREQADAAIAACPSAANYIRPHATARHTMAGREIYCIDLDSVGNSASVPYVFGERIEHVRESREESDSADIRRQAATPRRWTTRTIPRPGVLLVLPVTSGKNYCVFPVVRLDPARYAANNASIVCSATTLYVESDSYYVFGVLQSSMHRAWIYALCGTNGPSTRYNTQLYKSFVWPPPSTANAAAKQAVSAAAQAIQVERDFKQTLRDTRSDEERRKSEAGSPHALYCRDAMDEHLALLHRELDAAVEAAYGVERPFANDAERFAFLVGLFNRTADAAADGGVKKRQTTIGETMALQKRAKIAATDAAPINAAN